MCSRKCFRMPTLVICGVVLTIVLVCITGITLTNSINISNIVKLREKVASDSAAANGGHQAAQTRAALVEQQYSTLQQHHMSKSDFNYISAATHPKNLQRLLQAPPAVAASSASASAPKIVIEIGLRNSGNNNESNVNGAASLMPMPHMLQAADALMEGNVDSISLPAAAAAVAVAAAAAVAATTSSTSTEASIKTTTATTNTTTNTVESTSTTASTFSAPLEFGIADHNPAGIQFERRAQVKKVSCNWDVTGIKTTWKSFDFSPIMCNIMAGRWIILSWVHLLTAGTISFNLKL